MEVQIFGTRKCAETRKALRFFAERRVRTHFVDLAIRSLSPRELGRFAQKFGVHALVNTRAPRHRELGLHAARHSEARLLEILTAEPRLLRTPLVRWGKEITVGAADDVWRGWKE